MMAEFIFNYNLFYKEMIVAAINIIIPKDEEMMEVDDAGG